MFVASDVGKDEFFNAACIRREGLEIAPYQRCNRGLDVNCQYVDVGEGKKIMN